MINYAHRGASEYAPENTLSSFYLGLVMGANGIETDVKRTKDGVLVLFHDDTLERVTGVKGSVSDYTLKELSKFKVTGNSTCGFYDRIVTFREFLEKFASYDISFAIELKTDGIEKEVVDLIREFGIEKKTTVTSFKFDYIKKTKEYAPDIRVGFLTNSDGVADIEKLKNIGGEEMAPMAADMTQESVSVLRENGFDVRAWGVTNVELMKKMCALSVDGMTVNFPDRLMQFLGSK